MCSYKYHKNDVRLEEALDGDNWHWHRKQAFSGGLKTPKKKMTCSRCCQRETRISRKKKNLVIPACSQRNKKYKKKYEVSIRLTRTGLPNFHFIMKCDYENQPIKSLECASQRDRTSQLYFRYEVEL